MCCTFCQDWLCHVSGAFDARRHKIIEDMVAVVLAYSHTPLSD